MFCPKCGKSDQTPESYCRQCGIFLPDLSKPHKTLAAPETHLRANIVLSSLTIVTTLTLAILLYSILAFKADTHPLIYATAGLLIAMSFWHAQTLWRTLILRKQFKALKPGRVGEIEGEDATTGKLLESADFENMVPASVTDRTTKHLTATEKHSAQSQHQSN